MFLSFEIPYFRDNVSVTVMNGDHGLDWALLSSEIALTQFALWYEI